MVEICIIVEVVLWGVMKVSKIVVAAIVIVFWSIIAGMLMVVILVDVLVDVSVNISVNILIVLVRGMFQIGIILVVCTICNVQKVL